MNRRNNKTIKIEYYYIDEIKKWNHNPKAHDLEQIEKSIDLYGFRDPIAINKKLNNRILEGHGRLEVLLKKYKDKEKPPEGITVCKGKWKIPVIVFNDDKITHEKYALIHNRTTELGGWNEDELKEVLDRIYNDEEYLGLEGTGFTEDEYNELMKKYSESEKVGHTKLIDKFIIPPFSILDTRQGYWQDRKRGWIDLGINSELGRDAECLKAGIGEKYGRKQQTGTSIFDPVLCEIIYKWFCIDNGKILDPFAGGSVRGIDLSNIQIKANQKQAKEMKLNPNWICGDSLEMDKLINDEDKYDLIFTCPPYYNLEVYSDDDRDGSNFKSYDEFIKWYARIFEKSVKYLKDDRFLVVVIGEIRNKQGNYYNFVGDTIKCFKDLGLMYYNEIILVNTIGSLPVRVTKHFSSYRKIGKCHQNVLVFYKGNTKNIKNNYKSEIDICQ